ncbi:MAG: hypothetical protein H5U40_13035 [Polyangiaceae bacterium]|nr:hypothetical protein [Polyangiaceae bacterium]
MSGNADRRGSFPTRRGHGASANEPPSGSDPEPQSGESVYDHVPMVEVEAVHQQGPVPQDGEPLRTLEVWTQHHVYKMSPAMVCVEVRDLSTDAADRTSEFLGQRLVGGQRLDGARIELSHPFPRPGADAVFEKVDGSAGALSRTSPVRRVVLRLHVVTVDSRGVAPTWAELKRVSSRPAPGQPDEKRPGTRTE